VSNDELLVHDRYRDAAGLRIGVEKIHHGAVRHLAEIAPEQEPHYAQAILLRIGKGQPVLYILLTTNHFPFGQGHLEIFGRVEGTGLPISAKQSFQN